MNYTCKSCSKPLKFFHEIEAGLLCSECGPGSAKWQEEEKTAKDQQMREQIRLAIAAERENIDKKVKEEAQTAMDAFKAKMRDEVRAEMLAEIAAKPPEAKEVKA